MVLLSSYDFILLTEQTQPRDRSVSAGAGIWTYRPSGGAVLVLCSPELLFRDLSIINVFPNF